jgi:hypothetical protein
LRQQGAVAAVDIGLPHQAFADQETAHAVARHVGQILGREQPAFGNDQTVLGHPARQFARGVER